MYEEIQDVALYVRYSSTNQTEQSIEGQIRVCKEFCQRHGFRIVEIYADRATSASKDIEKRVEFLRMIKDSEKRNFQGVVVYKLDRFSRSRYDSANYKYRLRKNGVQLISATENISNDPEGIILESVLEGMAEFYSAELSQKINRGLKESAYKHNSIGGAIPLGYKSEGKKLVIDEETAPIVRQAFEMYAEGHSVAEICRTFNARGYKTSKGTRFGKSSFSKMFHNERYIGVYQFHDYRAENAIPAIIDKKLFQQVQARMKTTSKAPGQHKARRVYLLSGKLYCGHCGSKMNANSNGTGNYTYYECYGKKNLHANCNKRNLRQDFIEDVVIRDALSLLTDENIKQIAEVAVRTNLQDVEGTTNIPAIKGRLHETKVSLDNIVKAIESGLAPETLVKRMMELEKDKKTLEAELKKEEKTVIYLDEEQVIYWLEQFKGGNIEDDDFRRLLIDLFINHVTVWDEEDDHFKVTIAYNLTSLHEKTYHLKKGGRLSDLSSMHRDGMCQIVRSEEQRDEHHQRGHDAPRAHLRRFRKLREDFLLGLGFAAPAEEDDRKQCADRQRRQQRHVETDIRNIAAGSDHHRPEVDGRRRRAHDGEHKDERSRLFLGKAHGADHGGHHRAENENGDAARAGQRAGDDHHHAHDGKQNPLVAHAGNNFPRHNVNRARL